MALYFMVKPGGPGGASDMEVRFLEQWFCQYSHLPITLQEPRHV